MSGRITISVTEEVGCWLRQKAKDENSSVSELVARILQNEMRGGDEYWRAYARWKKIDDIAGIGAARRLARDKAHERG